jgi:hypothetical protein
MRLLTAALVILLFACNRAEKVPAGILPKEKMQSLMWDMVRADELVTYKASMDTSIKQLPASVGLYKSVLSLHNVTEKQFKESFKYYEAHPKLFKSVIDSLSRKASYINNAPPAAY